MTTVAKFAVIGVAGLLNASALANSCLSDPVSVSPNLVTSVFGKTRNLAQYPSPQVHWGTDFQARNPANPSVGADLLAVDDGTVVGAGFWGSGYGNRVVLKRSNGDLVIYSHLASVDPKLKSGSVVGFKEGGAGVGTQAVTSGTKVGVAGGTSNHMESNGLPVHLHLEYVTNYSGVKVRETNDGTNSTRSRYMRDVLEYMCHAIPLAPGAGSGASGTSTPTPQGGDAQAVEAARTQPSVTDKERYGIPDAPPYASYEGMSESQIIEAEMLRRTLDQEWDQKLIGWGKRGLWMEITRMRGVKLWMESRIAEKRSRIEGMLSTKLAFQTNQYFNPKLHAAYSIAEKNVLSQRIK